MNYVKNVNKVLNGSPGLKQLKNLRKRFSTLEASRTENGKIIMTQIVQRVDQLQPNSIGARFRRLKKHIK